jgi:hypothetical protein
MPRVKVETTVAAPREALFDYVVDVAGRPAFSDHYLKDYRLARAHSRGEGAAASFLFDSPLFAERAHLAIVEAKRPERIVEEGTLGRRGRSRAGTVYEFHSEAGGSTRVELTTYSEPATRIDAFRQARSRRWLKRQTKKALERLRALFEESSTKTPARVGMAGYEQLKSARFGDHPVRGE